VARETDFPFSFRRCPFSYLLKRGRLRRQTFLLSFPQIANSSVQKSGGEEDRLSFPQMLILLSAQTSEGDVDRLSFSPSPR